MGDATTSAMWMKKFPFLDNTTPYYFKYKDIEIYDNRWMMLALRLSKKLDNRPDEARGPRS